MRVCAVMRLQGLNTVFKDTETSKGFLLDDVSHLLLPDLMQYASENPAV